MTVNICGHNLDMDYSTTYESDEGVLLLTRYFPCSVCDKSYATTQGINGVFQYWENVSYDPQKPGKEYGWVEITKP